MVNETSGMGIRFESKSGNQISFCYDEKSMFKKDLGKLKEGLNDEAQTKISDFIRSL